MLKMASCNMMEDFRTICLPVKASCITTMDVSVLKAILRRATLTALENSTLRKADSSMKAILTQAITTVQGQLFRPNGRVYYDGTFQNGKFEGQGILYGVLGNTMYSGPFHSGELDVVPLIGLSLEELGQRLLVTPDLVASQDNIDKYVIDYPDFYFSVRSKMDTTGPVIDGLVFYGAQDYLDIISETPEGGSVPGPTVQVQGPQLSADWINPYTTYDWIMDKETPLLDKDANSSYTLETYEYEGLLISVTRNAATGDILLYEIGVTPDE